MVQSDQVLSMLSEYMITKGRCAYMEAKISVLEMEIRSAYASLVTDQVLASSGQDGMPRGNEISRTVENLAIRLADGWVPDTLRDMNAELSELYRQRDILKNVLARVDAWLKGLTDRQRFVIEHQVIQNESWREVTNSFRQQFGESVSKDTLKRIKDRAVDTIISMAE
jgi:hypothetical protein